MAKTIARTHLQSGFSLLEVIIALTVFSMFITVYVTSQGYNLNDSAMIREEMKLKELTLRKINELIVKPPEFSEGLTLTSQTANFDDDKSYEAIITYKRLKLPELNKVLPKEEGEEASDESANGVEANFMNKIKENLEEIIWQVEVKVVNKETKASYTLSTWLTNAEAKLKKLDSF